jgi:outer membrane receptor protein involved in Fe transport
MPRRYGWAVAVIIVAGLALAACTRTSEEAATGSDLATVEPVEGTSVSRVTLTPDAAKRLDIQTAPVLEQRGAGNGPQGTTIPYAAVIYDPNGETWAYTNPEPLVFVRQSITVDRIQGELAVLSSGPPPGTPVVSVGAAELLGTEYEVGEE